MKGPLYKNKTDLFKTDTSLRIFINIFLFLFVIGVIIYVGVFINNFAFEHTYFKNPGAPGTLTSDRYSFNWIVLMLSVVSQVFMIFCITLMIIYRSNFCSNIFSFLFYILFFITLVFVVIMLGLEYGDCNASDQPNNICNDNLWCCVYYTNPSNMCPNTLACVAPITVSDLTPLFEFETIFFTNVIIVGLHLIFITVFMVYWFSDANTIVKKQHIGEDNKDDDNNNNNIGNTFKPLTTKFQNHSLRKRTPQSKNIK